MCGDEACHTYPVDFLLTKCFGRSLRNEGSVDHWNEYKCAEEHTSSDVGIRGLEGASIGVSKASERIV
jgi:hypothetical protein